MKILVFLLIIIGLGSLVIMVVQHEQVHVEIYRGYGINTTVDYFNKDLTPLTYPDAPCPTEACYLANDINEAFTYVLLPVLAFMFIASLIVVVQLSTISSQLAEALEE